MLNIATKVLSLLKLSQNPLIEVKQSIITKEAGQGVFAVKTIKQNIPLCLYPGRYTPPIPHSLGIGDDSIGSSPNVMFHQPKLEENAYILNLPSLGGYLDGLDLNDIDVTNPSAVGHLINHPSNKVSNVSIIPFLWRDIKIQLEKEKEEKEKDKKAKKKKFNKL